MKLTKEKNGSALTVSLSGELNTMTAPELSKLLEAELGDIQALTLNFAECDYVSSAGLRVLLATFKQLKAKGGSMALTNVGENFMDVLQNTGLDAVFDLQ